MTEVAEISQLKEAPEAMRVDRVYHDVLHRDADPRGKRKYEVAAVKENLKDPSFTDSRITTRYY